MSIHTTVYAMPAGSAAASGSDPDCAVSTCGSVAADDMDDMVPNCAQALDFLAKEALNAHQPISGQGKYLMSPDQKQLDDIQKDVLKRLKRIEGQIRGIGRMVEASKDCEDILTQVKAVRSAMNSANALVLKRYLLNCHADMTASKDPEEREKHLEKTASIISNFLS